MRSLFKIGDLILEVTSYFNSLYKTEYQGAQHANEMIQVENSPNGSKRKDVRI